MKKIIVDERIQSVQDKIYKEVYYLVLVMCLVSIAIKSLYYGFEAKMLITEAVIILTSIGYFGIKTILLGTYYEINEEKIKRSSTKKNALVGGFVGVLIAVFFGVRSSIIYADQGEKLYYFILVFVAALIIYLPVLLVATVLPDYMANKISKRMSEKQLGDYDEES
jgi:uncharacterized membrane protein